MSSTTSYAEYPKGSEWGRWDLQIQTALDDGYTGLATYAEELKASQPVKWREYVAKVGGESNALLFDSKEYFSDGSVDKTERCRNYARNLFAFLEVFNPELRCIGITDHNYGDEELLDSFVAYSKKAKCKIIPGVEINCHGIHMLLFFSKPPCKQPTFSEGITTLLNRENKKFQFEYVSGSLENSFEIEDAAENAILLRKGIRQHVCEILEGGKEAFRKREQKYDFPAEQR